jgi:general secretion pathway protein G
MLNPSSSTSRRTLPRRRGFTLLEILVVLAILGLLVGLAVSNTDKIFGQSQETVARIFVRDSLTSSLVQYRIHNGDFPSTAEGLAALVTRPNGRERWNGPYVEVNGGKLPVDPWGEDYVYRCPGTQNKGKYDLFSKGADKIADTPDDIGNW